MAPQLARILGVSSPWLREQKPCNSLDKLFCWRVYLVDYLRFDRCVAFAERCMFGAFWGHSFQVLAGQDAATHSWECRDPNETPCFSEWIKSLVVLVPPSCHEWTLTDIASSRWLSHGEKFSSSTCGLLETAIDKTRSLRF